MLTDQPQTPQYIPESLNYKKTKKPSHAYSTTLKTKSRLKGLTNPNRRKITNMINHKLYEKYSSSQNYYYMKDINAVLANQRIPSVIKYRDLEDYMKKEEVLRRFYYFEEYDSKFQQLTEYYKFHKEIPRIFSKSEYDIYFDYHDRKRKVDFVKITNMLKRENGEDPFLEQKLELMRRRKKEYDPVLQNLSSFIRSSYRNSKMEIKKEMHFFSEKFQILNQSDTILDLYDKLNDIVSLSSILSFENSSDISLDNLTGKNRIKRENIGKNKNQRKKSKGKKLMNEMDMETSLLFRKTKRERLRSGISSEMISEKVLELKFGEKKIRKKNNFLGKFVKKKKKNMIKSEIGNRSKSKSKSKSKLKGRKKKNKKSEIFKKYSEKILKTSEDEKKHNKIKKFNWTKLNKNFGHIKKNTSKHPKKTHRKKHSQTKLESTKALSKKKPLSQRNNSHKTFKSSFATSRHKRESSLDKFREELSRFKYSKGNKGSHKTLKSSRSRKANSKTKGHYKTRSEFGLSNLAYLTRFDTQGSNNNLKSGIKSGGGKFDFDFINEKKGSFFAKKKTEPRDLKVKKFQLDNMYKSKFSNLKQELKFFKSQRKSKPITFGSGGSKKGVKAAKVNSKRAKKYLARKKHHRMESLSDMKFLKKSSEKYGVDKSNLLSHKILNRSKEPVLAKRGKHKHTRSEPEKLLMHNFIKKTEQEVNFKAFGGFKNLVEVGRKKDFRRESQPFNSYRSKRRGNSSGGSGFGQLLYSSRNV